MNDSLLREIGMADLDPVALEDEWQRLGRLDHLAVVQAKTGELVGYLSTEVDDSRAEIYFEAFTSEDALGRGIGTVLVEEAQLRARALARRLQKPVTLGTDVNGGGRALLDHCGFELVERNFAMFMDLDDRPPPPVWPEGVELRPYSQGVDDREFFEVMVRGFEMDPKTPLESWLERQKLPDYHPDLWWFAQSNAGPVGVLECREQWHAQRDTGWIKNLAVLPDWRRHGVGRALLLHAFALFHDRGRARVVLGVHAGNPTRAKDFYERVGMYAGAEGTEHRKVIPP
ncbi:MAG: GNAT family N-acetyltransferase [Actinomycetota bacterium]|nr:GNAT family N-acetyltransferase [Actinomycetota bacterium]